MPMLADHYPTALLFSEDLAFGALFAIIALAALAPKLAGRTDRRGRWSWGLVGGGAGMAAALPASIWAYCLGNVAMSLGIALFASPVFVLIGRRRLSLPVALGVFLVAVVVAVAVFIPGEVNGCWRGQSYASYGSDAQTRRHSLNLSTPLVIAWFISMVLLFRRPTEIAGST